jgi:hypothetical protein
MRPPGHTQHFRMNKESDASVPFDRYADIGSLAERTKRLLGQIWVYLFLLLGVEVTILILTKSPGAVAFGFITIGTLIIFGVWKQQGIGLPLVPLVAAQHLLIYGLPIVTDHETLRDYPSSLITEAGLEVLIFSLALTTAWSIGMRLFTPSPPISFALPDFQQGGSRKLMQLGMNLIMVGSVYQLLERAELLEFLFALLPSGSVSLVNPLITGMSSGGFFLVALFVGAKETSRSQLILFWSLLAASIGISASSFLLSSAITIIAAVLIGLFWGSGRVPWRFIVVVIVLLSFLNLGKFTMRGRYWQFDEDGPTVASYGFADIPRIYTEWGQASLEVLFEETQPVGGNFRNLPNASNRQSLMERINNLQNMLFVIEAVQIYHLEPLGGGSYSVIPPLLVPRIMWPNKPRSHIGQVMLNVHFGRQDLNSTYKTYVAWGLIPEAYGNFGRYFGSITLGAFLGFLFAWIENVSARKLLLSLEGFVSFAILVGLANSTEMVASVLVTMLFQSVVPIIVGAIPFLHRMVPKRPEVVR